MDVLLANASIKETLKTGILDVGLCETGIVYLDILLSRVIRLEFI